MSKYDSLISEREDLQQTLACVDQVTREFDTMTSQLITDNAQIAVLSEELRQLERSAGSYEWMRHAGWPDNEDPVPEAAFQEIEQSQAIQNALLKELCDAAATYAEELISWAESLDERRREQARKETGRKPASDSAAKREEAKGGSAGNVDGALTDAQRNLLREKNALAVAIITRYGDEGESSDTPESILDGPLKTTAWGSNVGWMPGTPKWDLRHQYKGFSDEDIALMESTRRNGVRALTLLAQAGKLSKSQVTALQLRGLGVLAEATLNLALVLVPYESIADAASAGLLGTTEVTVGAGVREFASPPEMAVENTFSENGEAPIVVGPTIGKSGYSTTKEFTDAVTAKYQALYDEAYVRTQELVRQGVISNNDFAIGAEIDVFARTGLRDWLLHTEGIKEGPGGIVAVNRRLYDPLDSGNYRVPDVYLPSEGLVLEGTISLKTGGSLQIRDYWTYSGGNVIVIRPASIITKGVKGSYSPIR